MAGAGDLGSRGSGVAGRVRRAATLGAAVAAAAGTAYALERAGARHWHVDQEQLAAAGRTLPSDLRHHFVATDDGGRVHAVERGRGPTTVLVHGIMLGVGAWAPQLRALPGRVVAVSQRGHGQSRAGTGGYAFERLAADLCTVLAALDVRDAVVAAHSMGGMVAQLLALDHPDVLARHARRLVLVATSPGPVAPAFGAVLAAGAGRALTSAERRGRGPLPKSVTVWAARASFGARPRPADVELTRALLDAMSPGALAALLPHLLRFDVRDRLGALRVPTTVVSGTRDLLTPPRTARTITARVPGATLRSLPGCGHMVMLERAEELCSILA